MGRRLANPSKVSEPNNIPRGLGGGGGFGTSGLFPTVRLDRADRVEPDDFADGRLAAGGWKPFCSSECSAIIFDRRGPKVCRNGERRFDRLHVIPKVRKQGKFEGKAIGDEADLSWSV